MQNNNQAGRVLDDNIVRLRAAIAKLDRMYPAGWPLHLPPVQPAAVHPPIVAAAVAHAVGANGNDGEGDDNNGPGDGNNNDVV